MTDLRAIAGRVGYEWTMMLGAADTSWHLDTTLQTLNLPEKAPLRVVHSHARTELVWLHARELYAFLFIKPDPKSDDLSVTSFLDDQARQDWGKKEGLRGEDLCPTLKKHYKRANKKLFHLTEARLTDTSGLPDYTVPIKELREAFAKCYGLMAEAECVAFREGLDDEWDVATVALTWP